MRDQTSGIKVTDQTTSKRPSLTYIAHLITVLRINLPSRPDFKNKPHVTYIARLT